MYVLLQVRAVAQGKHTKLDQLKKKMIGIEQSAIMREKLLENERSKNTRLEATMAHLERHLEGETGMRLRRGVQARGAPEAAVFRSS